MRIVSNRFGQIDLEEKDVIDFPRGLVGLRQERQFVLLRKTPESPVGWLQSVTTPALALPVVSVDALAADIPLGEMIDAVAQAGLDADIDQCAVMAVLCAPGATTAATVNLLAPIVVNATTRTGAQVILERAQFTAREPFALSTTNRKQFAASREAMVPANIAAPTASTTTATAL